MAEMTPQVSEVLEKALTLAGPNICTEPGGSRFATFRFPSFTSMTPMS
jgi:hypothetical protein